MAISLTADPGVLKVMQSPQLKMLQSEYMLAVTPIRLLVVSFDLLLDEWPLGSSACPNEFEGDLELKLEAPVMGTVL